MLGAYIGTALYCTLVLRQVHSESSQVDEFIPALATNFAILLTMICIALLVYFINHSATLIQAWTVIERAHHDLLDVIEATYPEPLDPERPARHDDLAAFRRRFMPQKGQRVEAHSAGYLRRIDEQALLRALPDGTAAIVYPPMGRYILAHTVLLEVDAAIDDARAARLRSAFILDRERSLTQDPLFGVRQLVDIALMALPPSANDPSTAGHALSALGDALCRLADRAFPASISVDEGDDDTKRVALWRNRPDYAAYVTAAFAQIRRYAGEDADILLPLLDVLTAVGRSVAGERAEPIRQQVLQVAEQVNAGRFIAADRDRLLAAVASAMDAATRST